MNDRDERPRDDAGTEQPGAAEPAFDDPGHAWVREVLADTRVTTPPPDEVVSRLDETLAALVAERERSGLPADAEPAATVVPLRRRVLPRLGAAAAAVILVAGGGVALTRLDLGGSPNADSASSADSAAGSAASPSGPGSAKGLATGAAPEALADAAAPSLSAASFAADAAAVMRRIAATDAALTGTQDGVGSASPSAPVPAQTPERSQTGSSSTTQGYAAAKAPQAPPVTATPEGLSTDQPAQGPARCPGPGVADAVTLPATLDGTPVVLVFRPPTTTGQLVEAWSCDGQTVLASATVAR